MDDQIPLLKEYRSEKLVASLQCIDVHSKNRLMQRDCILKKYPKYDYKSIEAFDKGVFRGMVLTALKSMQWITGSGNDIQTSSNGKLLINSYDSDLFDSVYSTLIYELDKNIYNFIDIIGVHNTELKDLENKLAEKKIGRSSKSFLERIRKWLYVLEEANLITKDNNLISVNEKTLNNSIKNLSPNTFSEDEFYNVLINSYFKICESKSDIIHIYLLRKEVCLKYLDSKRILTEKTFDILFNKISLESENYKISLGKPMKSGDRLLVYKEECYKTIFIRKKM